jgi:hypothetical protein
MVLPFSKEKLNHNPLRLQKIAGAKKFLKKLLTNHIFCGIIL